VSDTDPHADVFPSVPSCRAIKLTDRPTCVDLFLVILVLCTSSDIISRHRIQKRKKTLEKNLTEEVDSVTVMPAPGIQL